MTLGAQIWPGPEQFLPPTHHSKSIAGSVGQNSHEGNWFPPVQQLKTDDCSLLCNYNQFFQICCEHLKLV